MALVFSCVSALVGVAVIIWYGVGEIGKKEEAVMEGKIEELAKVVGVEGVEELAAAVVNRRGVGVGVGEGEGLCWSV